MNVIRSFSELFCIWISINCVL